MLGQALRWVSSTCVTGTITYSLYRGQGDMKTLGSGADKHCKESCLCWVVIADKAGVLAC